MKRMAEMIGVLSLEFVGAAVFLCVWQPTNAASPEPVFRLPSAAPSVRTLPNASPVVFPQSVQPQHSFWSQRLD
jgi:hypothetical protein